MAAAAMKLLKMERRRIILRRCRSLIRHARRARDFGLPGILPTSTQQLATHASADIANVRDACL